jgi:hypothetical protein
MRMMLTIERMTHETPAVTAETSRVNGPRVVPAPRGGQLARKVAAPV